MEDKVDGDGEKSGVNGLKMIVYQDGQKKHAHNDKRAAAVVRRFHFQPRGVASGGGRSIIPTFPKIQQQSEAHRSNKPIN